MRKILWISVLFLIFRCAGQTKENTTADFHEAEKLATLKSKKMKEISGIVASRNNPGLIWGHNDSGNEAEVFLIDKNLDIVLTCTLKGVNNRDWEDIAIGSGPDPSKNYIYVGEIGDNDAVYQFKHLYRFEEPTAQPGINELLISAFDTITFQLPDKRKDTETLLIDPVTNDIFVVSKRETPVWVYQMKAPINVKDTLTAVKIASLPLTKIVGGDISVDGKKLLLKNYEHIYYWENESGKSIVDLFTDRPTEVPYEVEPQGEAITWDITTSGFYTLSEKNKGKDSFLYFYKYKK